ncbi:hypothetical protein HYN56_10070 [Flavobacterium crocinum]|uniref:Uncharacterized protein n=1 Tax=Flavobacterium crocinum TaxID=2183896 RepID=A0A2S1YKM2_9FLAO|nr:hypothetical protein [Flavobacterium crocinum]AWK04556.1 hypothetical protein HYN56_10070 [Flavobacterium crocinum]
MIKIKEFQVRDFLCDNFNEFHKKITNLKDFKRALIDEKNAIYQSSEQICITDLVKLVLGEKIIHSTENIEFYKLIDKEFKLLETKSKKGKQPSVDILAYNTCSLNLALVELKISDSSEREAITELSAYTLGLQNRFHGLSNLQIIWIPISNEWRVTLMSAVELSMLWKNILTLPLQLEVHKDNKDLIKDLSFTIINPIREISEIDYLSLFSYECFDTFDYYTRSKVKNKNGFINYVTSIFNRQNINGFIIFHKNSPRAVYPHGFTLCIYNPYKGYLHKKVLKNILEYNKDLHFSEIIKEGRFINTDFIDVDFITDEVKHFEPEVKDLIGKSLKADAHWKKKFLSVGDFTDPEDDPNTSYGVKYLKEAIDSAKENPRAFGTPNFEIWFNNLESKDVSSVSYLGIFHDLISKKIQIEHKKNLHSKDFFSCLTSFYYLKKTFKMFNHH